MTSGDAIVERAGWNVPGEGSPKLRRGTGGSNIRQDHVCCIFVSPNGIGHRPWKECGCGIIRLDRTASKTNPAWEQRKGKCSGGRS